MINTLFYYADTEQDYLDKWNNGEIQEYTMCLCKDTKTLWKGGERYGKGGSSGGGDYDPYDDTELVNRINAIAEELQNLVDKIGEGGTGMTDEEKRQFEQMAGELTNLSDGLTETNRVAEEEKARLNGLLDGLQNSIDSITNTIEQESEEVSQIASDVQSQAAIIQEHADWIQNRQEEDVTSWKSGWNQNVEAYLTEVGVWARDNNIKKTDWTQLTQSVDTISSNVTSLQEDVQSKATKTLFSQLSQTANQISTRVASVENDLSSTKTQFSDIVQTANEISTKVAKVEGDLDSKADATEFSTLSQKVNSIDLAVQALTPSEEGGITEQLQSAINQSVEDKVASLNLSTTYAKKQTETDVENLQDDVDDLQSGTDNTKKVVEWMYSGLHMDAGGDKTVAELASAGKSNLVDAISSIRTQVNKLENGDYVSTASLETKVDNALAALYNSADSNSAKSLIFAKISKNEGDIADNKATAKQLASDLANGLDDINQNTEDIAAIVTSATGDSTGATIATKFANWKSGLATKSYVDGATASLITSDILDERTAGFITHSDLEEATATMASTADLEGYDSRISSVETKASSVESSLTNLTKAGGRLAKVEQKASDTEASISGIVDASTDKVTASKIWETIANDNSVLSSMQSQFATTVDGDGIASIVKEDIAQGINNSSWEEYIAYMKGDVKSAVENYSYVDEHKASWEQTAAYVDSKKNDINAIGGLSTDVGSVKDDVSNIKTNYAKTSMFASIKDSEGNVTAASVFAEANKDGSSVTLNADHINMNGQTTFVSGVQGIVGQTNIDGGRITTGTISANRIDAANLVVAKLAATGNDSDYAIIAGASSASSAPFTVTKSGKLKATDATITGNITANSLVIGSNAKSAITNITNDLYMGANAKIGSGNLSTDLNNTINDKLSSSDFTQANIIKKINNSETSTTIDGGKITTGTISANQIATNAITSDKIAANAITAGKIATGAITASKIDATDLVVAKLAATGDGADYAAIIGSSTASNAPFTVKTNGEMKATSGTIGGITLAANNISSGNGKFKVTSDGKLTASDATITGAITATSLTINSGAQSAITNITDGKYRKIDAVITSNDLASGLQTSINSIANKLDTSSFTAKNIVDKINATANTTTIDGGKITTGSITADLIAANTITGNKIASNTITADQINATNLKIAAGNVTGKLTASQIDATDLTAVKLAATSGTIGGMTITSESIYNGVTSLTDTQHNGVYVGRDGIALGKGAFNVDINGSLVAKDAKITGEINATKITLTNTTIPATSVTVTEGSTTSSLQTKLGDVVDIANSADSKADSAIADAGTAVTTANTAKSTADTAKATATTAKSTADTAASNASSAMTKANGAAKKVQTAYRSVAKGASRPTAPLDAVTDVSGSNGVWTTVRPVYDKAYGDLYVVTQTITQAGDVSTTSPVLDNTTTVIDGGNITTGTIAAARIDADNLKVKAANITGKLTASQIDATDLTAVKLAATSGTIGGFNIDETSLKDSGDGSIVLGATGSSWIDLSKYGILFNKRSGSAVSVTNALNADGSGSLASGNITWDTSGNISKLKLQQGTYTSTFENGTATFADSRISGQTVTIDGGSIKAVNSISGGMTTTVTGDGVSASGAVMALSGNYTGKTTISNVGVRVLNGNAVKASIDAENGDITTKGDASIDGNLTVLGNSDFDASITVNDDTYINGIIFFGSGGGIDSGDEDFSFNIGGTFTSNKALSVSSDENLKNIVSPINIAIEDIAKTRIVDFTYKNDESGKLYTGTIAQDWETLIPNTVSKDAEGNLALDYSAVSVVAAVTAAKEIVKLKKKNEELEARLAAIEAKLGL